MSDIEEIIRRREIAGINWYSFPASGNLACCIEKMAGN